MCIRDENAPREAALIQNSGDHVTVAAHDDVPHRTGALGEHGRTETVGQLEARVTAAGGRRHARAAAGAGDERCEGDEDEEPTNDGRRTTDDEKGRRTTD